MERKKIVYQVILDCWDIAKRYLFIPLDDTLWEQMNDEIEAKSAHYKTMGNNVWKLYRGIIVALVDFKDKEDKASGKA